MTPSFRDGPEDQTRNSRFSGVQLHTIVRCCAPPRNDEQTLHRRGIHSSAQWSPSEQLRSLDTASRSRRAFRARFAVEFPPSANRGRRECRAPGAPAAARAKVESTRVSHHGRTGNTRHSPRNGFNGFLRALPGDRAFLPPSPARCESISPDLMPASGRQDHTTSPSASAPFVNAHLRVHRIPPHVRDDRETPLLSRRDGASW